MAAMPRAINSVPLMAVRQSAPCIRTAISVSTAGQRQQERGASVRVGFFKFGKNGVNAEAAGIYGSQVGKIPSTLEWIGR